MTLRQLLDEFGITTYEGLLSRCERMGVAAPDNKEFAAADPPVVNSPTEGVVVLEAPRVVKESTGKYIDPDVPVVDPIDVVVLTEPGQFEQLLSTALTEQIGPTEGSTKKLRKKKDGQSGTTSE